MTRLPRFFALALLFPALLAVCAIAATSPVELAEIPAATSRACESGCETGTIQAAVDAASPGDTIYLSAGNHADNVVIDKELTIRGAGPEATTVWGRARGTVFIVRDAVVTLADMAITDGDAPYGGGVLVEGLTADLHLDNCHIYDNHAGGGGGIYSADGAVTITTNTISGNVSGWGGGVVAYGGDLSIQGSSIIGNFAYYLAGVFAISDGSEMDLSIVESTISDNESGQDIDFAVDVLAWDFPLHATILNSTISGNSGGGMIMRQAYNLLDAEIVNATFHANGWNPDLLLGGLWASGPAVTVRGSIIAGNAGPSECYPRAFLTSLGGNISGDASCDFRHPTDLENTDPLLLPLADNGGPTPTHALDPASPAIDAAGLDCLPNDQRGVVRPQDGDSDGVAACDSGAFEVTSAVLGIDIEIMPRSKQNRIDLQTRRAIPVAVLGSESFDVTHIDVESLRFGPKQVPPLRSVNGLFPQQNYSRDYNRDGHDDLVTWFLVRGAGIACGDTTAELSGETFDGEQFHGADAIETVNCATEFGRVD